MELVADLRSRGTWNMDTIGIGSAANQGFAAWVYSTLMPTVYERYSITSCRDAGDDLLHGAEGNGRRRRQPELHRDRPAPSARMVPGSSRCRA